MENHLVAANGTVNGQSVNANFTWDPLGRLHQVTINGVARQFLHDGDALVAEYNSSGLLRRYVHGDQVDEPLVQYDGANVGTSYRRYLHADHQGSVIAQSGSTGSVLSTNAYDPYGIPASTNSGRFGYTGQAWLPELGLYHYKARMYHPRLGRFLQTDPIFYADDMNMYGYVISDPVNRNDALGLWSSPAHQRLIQNAFKNTLTPKQIALIGKGSRRADSIFRGNQAPEKSYMHSMRSPGQSVAEAKAQTSAYINSKLDEAIALQGEGKHDQALIAFGEAVHAVMDGLSPVHTDANGDPIEWIGIKENPGHGGRESVSEYWNDPACQECVDDITEDVFRLSAEAMQRDYQSTFGRRGSVIIEVVN